MKRIVKVIPAPLLTGLLVISSALPALAQEGGGTTKGSSSVLQLILHGGPLLILIWCGILGASITMVTLVIQNFMTLRNAKLAPPTMVNVLAQNIQSGNYQEAWENCRANNNYVGNVLKVGLERIGRGKEATEDAISESALREAQTVRTRNSYLSVIGVVSPMIGLLGTVIGMMNAFATLGSSGIADPRALAQSIGEVLLATASGLFIAIPAFIFYYVFRNRSQAVIVYADDIINTLVRDLPYEELQGVRIGDTFSAGGAPEAGYPQMTVPGMPGAPGFQQAPGYPQAPGFPPAGPGAPRPPMPPAFGGVPQAPAAPARKVSMSLSTNCPICNGTINAGTSPCPHCGSSLDWA